MPDRILLNTIVFVKKNCGINILKENLDKFQI